MIPVGSQPGDPICFGINIIDDNIAENSENFTVHLEVQDLNAVVAEPYSYATIRIIDDGEWIDACKLLVQWNLELSILYS